MFIQFFFAFHFKEVGSSCTQKNHKAQNKNIFVLNLWNFTEASMRNVHTNMNCLGLRQHNHNSTKNTRSLLPCLLFTCNSTLSVWNYERYLPFLTGHWQIPQWPRSFLVIFFSGLLQVLRVFNFYKHDLLDERLTNAICVTL